MRRTALGLLPVALLAAGCGGTKTVTVTETVTVPTTVTATTEQPDTMTLRIYEVQEGQLRPVAVQVPRTKAVAKAALRVLGLPTLGSLSNGVLSLTIDRQLTHGELAQIVYTLTQFPTIQKVKINGDLMMRSDFEDVTPAILVESPLPGAQITSPLRATGTANTFEATFEYDLTDADGKIVAHNFVTATSGTGTRGTFDFQAPFKLERPGLGELIVYERSAANGSRIHIQEIPIQLEP